MRASSVKQSGAGLSTLRAEYIQRYDRLLDREKQPHSDFFVNLSVDFEEELDFNEDEPADLSQYNQYFEWDEAEYMRLRFTAARHYASRGHWNDVLRTRPDNVPQHEDTYNRNAQAWYYTNARINELVQEAEQILEAQDRQMPWEPQFGPPRDSLIPPGHSTGTPSPIREQESDSTLSPEKEGGGIETPSPQRLEGGQGYQRPLHGGYIPQLGIASKEVMCSFCGVSTHDYRDCPVMHQYIREQADALAQRRLEEYQQPREWEGYKIPRQVPPYQGPLFRGGDPMKEDQCLVRGSLSKKFRGREQQLSQE